MADVAAEAATDEKVQLDDAGYEGATFLFQSAQSLEADVQAAQALVNSAQSTSVTTTQSADGQSTDIEDNNENYDNDEDITFSQVSDSVGDNQRSARTPSAEPPGRHATRFLSAGRKRDSAESQMAKSKSTLIVEPYPSPAKSQSVKKPRRITAASKRDSADDESEEARRQAHEERQLSELNKSDTATPASAEVGDKSKDDINEIEEDNDKDEPPASATHPNTKKRKTTRTANTDFPPLEDVLSNVSVRTPRTRSGRQQSTPTISPQKNAMEKPADSKQQSVGETPIRRELIKILPKPLDDEKEGEDTSPFEEETQYEDVQSPPSTPAKTIHAVEEQEDHQAEEQEEEGFEQYPLFNNPTVFDDPLEVFSKEISRDGEAVSQTSSHLHKIGCVVEQWLRLYGGSVGYIIGTLHRTSFNVKIAELILKRIKSGEYTVFPSNLRGAFTIKDDRDLKKGYEGDGEALEKVIAKHGRQYVLVRKVYWDSFTHIRENI